MNKTRMKTTAALLIAIFMTSIFAVAMPVGAVTEDITVPYATVSVVYLPDSVTWTIDMDEVNGPFANGHANVGLVIGIGDNILYQVHLNGGTCDAFPWGTWLYSEYDPDPEGGWHTSEEAWNTPISEMNDIDATGDRYIVAGEYDDDMPWGPVYHEGNPDLIFTITISKSLLATEFKWALWLDGNVNFARVEDALAWQDTDTINFHTGTLPTPTIPTKGDVLREKEVPGEGIDEAPGLKKSRPNENFAKGHGPNGHAHGPKNGKGGK